MQHLRRFSRTHIDVNKIQSTISSEAYINNSHSMSEVQKNSYSQARKNNMYR